MLKGKISVEYTILSSLDEYKIKWMTKSFLKVLNRI